MEELASRKLQGRLILQCIAYLRCLSEVVFSGDVVPAGAWVLTVTAVLRHSWAQTPLFVCWCSLIHTTATVIETTPDPTIAFQCIAAVTSAMTKKGQTLITPMDDLTPPCGTEELVVVPSFFQSASWFKPCRQLLS